MFNDEENVENKFIPVIMNFITPNINSGSFCPESYSFISDYYKAHTGDSFQQWETGKCPYIKLHQDYTHL